MKNGKLKTILIGFVVYIMLVVTTVTKSYDRYQYRTSDFATNSMKLWNFIESASLLWALFLLFIPLILFLIRRYEYNSIPKKSYVWIKNSVIHVLSSTLITFVHAALYITIVSYIRGFDSVFNFNVEFIRLMNSNMAYYTIIDVFIYIILLAWYYLASYYNEIRIGQLRSIDLESQLSIVRLEALKMQIQPHFVFNALHNINALLHENVALAKENLNRLKSLMQRSHENLERQLISLNEEMQFIEAYLGVEQTRFADRLRVYYEIDEFAPRAIVPSMVLQPVIENAIKHGISKSASFGIIKITAKKENKNLILTVEDNGPGLSESHEKHEAGIGVLNTMNRLEILYDWHEYSMSPSSLGGLKVEIIIPYLES
ncbi:hypothetical protein EP331_11555 [bacterium]|nr:MAG: hypothetical protein EP331_11555 [bacterium]